MRARNLKPGFFKNEVLGKSDPINGHIFQGLWCLSDREGRLEDRPDRIHLEINGYRDLKTTAHALDWLAKHGFIRRYKVKRDKYIQVLKFNEHQNPHHTEKGSKLPGPNGELTVKAPKPNGHDPADSLLLIPDSGLPITDSGFPTPDPQEPDDQKVVNRKRAEELRAAICGGEADRRIKESRR